MQLLSIKQSSQYKKDLKKAKKSNKDLEKLKLILELIIKKNPIPIKNKSHALKGNWYGYMELHIEPDWLLIYKIKKEGGK